MTYTLQNIPTNITNFKDWLVCVNEVGNNQVFNLILVGCFLFFFTLFNRFVDSVNSLVYSGVITALLGILLTSIGGLVNESLLIILLLAGGVGLLISYLSRM